MKFIRFQGFAHVAKDILWPITETSLSLNPHAVSFYNFVIKLIRIT